jgi:hypothetical protein
MPAATESSKASDVADRPGPRPPDAPISAPSAVPAETGKLRVIVEAAGHFSGLVGLVGPDGRARDQQNIWGDDNKSILFENLKPGNHRALFVPSLGHAPTSADVKVIEGTESTVVLKLTPASVLRGIAVDALLRPLAKVHLGVELPSALPAMEGAARDLMAGGGGRASSAPGGTGHGTWFYSVSSTGSVKLEATTGTDGTFSIAGLPSNAVTLQVTYEKLRFTQSCLVDSEVRIVVPVQPIAPTPDPELQEFRRAADVLMKGMIEHPETGDVYWAQLKALLEGWIARPGFPEPERKAVQDSIRTTEELRAKSKK